MTQTITASGLSGYLNTIPEKARHFAVIDPEMIPAVVAEYDYRPGYLFCAPFGCDEQGRVCFVGEPRAYFHDQLEELH